MSVQATTERPGADWPFQLEPSAYAELRGLFGKTAGLRRVWVFGSRARGDARARSDIDLAIEAPTWSARQLAELEDAIKQLPMVYPVDAVLWSGALKPEFRTRIERDRKVFWEPHLPPSEVDAVGGMQPKRFQSQVLAQVGRYLDELNRQQAISRKKVEQLRVMDEMEEETRKAADFPARTWEALRKMDALPPAFADRPYSGRFDGAGAAVPNVCLKVPTGGGKTLLAAASVARVFSSHFKRHAGLVLWVVPNEAIYRQTLKALSDRDHPYRQILNVAGAGRVKVLEKTSPLNRLDVESNLCVMLLMLQSAARRSKETLRFFRDRGNVIGFLPREDDIEAHWRLLEQVPNLDVYAPWGSSAEADQLAARRQKGSIIKSSLGNIMRLLRPMVVIDEGQHAYTENALRTLDGFNPGFLLELSATPRVASEKTPGSNILADVRGVDLDEAEMIKLPIHVEVHRWADWQSCLGTSVARLDALQGEADMLRGETLRYIRPILLVQVERTGADLRDAGFIHAEDARTHLLQLGFSEREIAVKTSERNDLAAPENLDLLSPHCPVRAIITKQALQEGWDCPFAYVLCALAAGRDPAAMTQLVGRILRMPQVAKTGRADLDACYVFCHDAGTAQVVKGIKRSLESEGMGDLAIRVHGDADDPEAPKPLALKRRPAFASLRIFVPRVTWQETGGARRELVYDSDILARVPWDRFDAAKLARGWAPDSSATIGQRFTYDLAGAHAEPAVRPRALRLDRVRLVRALLDLAPNAWHVWRWVEVACERLCEAGHEEATLARSSDSLAERLRVDIEAERDRLAQSVFDEGVAEGRIEFRLRADATDYELPREFTLLLTEKAQPLLRDDGIHPVRKSLLEPALRTPDMNDFEAQFAAYLDERGALSWWHRNVAKTQYGLQGWKRYRVYPDFVFGVLTQNGASRTVVMETKGMHLAGSLDTQYKQQLLQRLTDAFADERAHKTGQLILATQRGEVVCDMVFDEAWRGALERRHFSGLD
ncbi:MAG: DEAD/DEAH box helicase family protein [Rhodanobacteraceae bacterium]